MNRVNAAVEAIDALLKLVEDDYGVNGVCANEPDTEATNTGEFPTRQHRRPTPTFRFP